ncbi:MAG: S-methyl-5-thioribose-1-phosphate isomerase [Sphingobacteriia bacterium]|nr:S-methyl-5-thioribose-1-phosphate isomerase [Sphingobacteriia bacterium]
MNVNGKDYRTIWMEGSSVFMIDQNRLPFEFVIFKSENYLTTCKAITDMTTRGAGAIGAAAGFAMAQALMSKPEKTNDLFIEQAKKDIQKTRPTARNLFYAVELVFEAGKNGAEEAFRMAQQIAEKDIDDSRAIGFYGNDLIEDSSSILTHCNAGWLAFVDYGTALSPIYTACNSGKKVFVWADETRPRSQGARLTAWELYNAGIPHRIVPDSAGAWLMAQKKINLIITGADRIAANGDTANKIGTFEKAVLANYFKIPFYIAAPTSTFDLNCSTGNEIIIEQRNPEEVLYQTGPDEKGIIHRIRVASPGSTAINPAFDVTPASLITGIISEKGIIKADQESIRKVTSKN